MNPLKQVKALVADEQVDAPEAHLTHEDPTNPYPAIQVKAVTFELQVAAPVPQALQVLAVAFK